MLEQYFLKLGIVGPIRCSWLGEPIQRYVNWLSSQDRASAWAANRRASDSAVAEDVGRAAATTAAGTAPVTRRVLNERTGSSPIFPKRTRKEPRVLTREQTRAPAQEPTQKRT